MEIKTGPVTSDATLRTILAQLQAPLANALLNTGGLAIKAASSALAKTVNTVKALVNGVLVTKAAGDMAALSGTLATATKNVAVFTMNAAGTLATRMGTAGATIGAIVFPTVPDTDVVLGFAIIENATGSDWVGGTDLLDEASLTVTYVDTPYPITFDVATLGA